MDSNLSGIDHQAPSQEYSFATCGMTDASSMTRLQARRSQAEQLALRPIHALLHESERVTNDLARSFVVILIVERVNALRVIRQSERDTNLVELKADGPAGHFEGLNLRLYNAKVRVLGADVLTASLAPADALLGAAYRSVSSAASAHNWPSQHQPGDSQLLFRDADDFTEMLLLLDRVEHECRDCFARNRETHLGSSALPASIRRVIFLSETRRADDCPIDPVVTHDFLHGTRIAHVISKDKTDDPIGDTGKVRGSRENNESLHS
jgi:hypothetical protein